MFTLIDSRTLENISISFNHYYLTFSREICLYVNTLKLALFFYLKVYSDLHTGV